MKGISERAGRVQTRARGQFPIIVIYYLGQIVTPAGPDGQRSLQRAASPRADRR